MENAPPGTFPHLVYLLSISTVGDCASLTARASNLRALIIPLTINHGRSAAEQEVH